MQRHDLTEGGVTQLTEKQREAVNLLIQHKTSKEISRILGISPHTVDQRIESAKKKFGVVTRGELAQAYQKHLTMGERLTYENFPMSAEPLADESSISDEPERFQPMLDPNWSRQSGTDTSPTGYRVVHELFYGPGGSWYRLAAITAIAVLLIISVLGGISIFVVLTEVLHQQGVG